MRALPAGALIILAAFATPPLAAQESASCSTPRDACAFFDTFLTAFNRRDWDAFRATLADDISVIFDSPEQPERQDGRLAVERFFQAIFPSPGLQPRPLPPPLKPDNLVAKDLGDVVIISFHLRAPDHVARRTIVLHRTVSGWRVIHIHGSSFDLPSQPGGR